MSDGPMARTLILLTSHVFMSKYPQGKYDRHPLNAPGPFYVEDGDCIECRGPQGKAPALIGFFEEPPSLRGCNHCYIRQQPRTSQEVDAMVQAILSSLCSGLRYCGDDPAVLQRLKQAGLASRCDELSDGPQAPPPA